MRALFFDKAPAANWKVSWPQDTVIAVAEHIKAHGFTGWSQKDGVPHVCPPAAILERMVALRSHLGVPTDRRVCCPARIARAS